MLLFTIPIPASQSKYQKADEADLKDFDNSWLFRTFRFWSHCNYPGTSSAWFDETHLAIAKVAGYEKLFNAAAPDIARIKLGDKGGAARLRHIAGSKWGQKHYLNMDLLKDQELEEQIGAA